MIQALLVEYFASVKLLDELKETLEKKNTEYSESVKLVTEIKEKLERREEGRC